MSPRPDVSEERRNQILEAAMAVFARQGFEQARMDDIAQEVGLSKGALYLYFKSKDAIISAILQFFFSAAMKKLQGFLESEETPSVREQLLRLNQYYVGEMKWMVSMLPISFQFYAITALYEGLVLLWMVDPDATRWEHTGECSLMLLLGGLAVPR